MAGGKPVAAIAVQIAGCRACDVRRQIHLRLVDYQNHGNRFAFNASGF